MTNASLAKPPTVRHRAKAARAKTKTTKSPKRPTTVARLAMAAIRRSPVIADQIDFVAEQIAKDPVLRRRYVEATFGMVAASTCRRTRHGVRMTPRDSWLDPSSARGIAAVCTAMGILDAFIVGNKRLGDCTAADLEAAARERELVAKGCHREAAFYRTLARRIASTPEKTVRDAWTATAVAKLRPE